MQAGQHTKKSLLTAYEAECWSKRLFTALLLLLLLLQEEERNAASSKHDNGEINRNEESSNKLAFGN